MSTKTWRMNTITCDCCFAPCPHTATSVAEARQHARRAGWRRLPKNDKKHPNADLCPACSRKPREAW